MDQASSESRFRTLDVVEVELGDEGEVVAEGFGLDGKGRGCSPRWRASAFVVDVAKPAAEDGEPEAVAHRYEGIANERWGGVSRNAPVRPVSGRADGPLWLAKERVGDGTRGAAGG